MTSDDPVTTCVTVYRCAVVGLAAESLVIWTIFVEFISCSCHHSQNWRTVVTLHRYTAKVHPPWRSCLYSKHGPRYVCANYPAVSLITCTAF